MVNQTQPQAVTDTRQICSLHTACSTGNSTVELNARQLHFSPELELHVTMFYYRRQDKKLAHPAAERHTVSYTGH